jgi:hypothetical protein
MEIDVAQRSQRRVVRRLRHALRADEVQGLLEQRQELEAVHGDLATIQDREIHSPVHHEFGQQLTQALVAGAEFTRWLVGRTPSRRWGDVEDLVGAAVFLASEASNFVNGHILYVDGGVTATL